MSDGRRFLLSAIGFRLTVIRYRTGPYSRKQEGGRLRRRGDSPALPRGLRVVFASLRGRIRIAALEYIPGRKRVQAPAAPGFYQSCAGALTDGFCPQSGLVQRGAFYAAFGSGPPLVAGATTFLHGKASHTILRSLALPYESCSLATPLRWGHYGCWVMASI